jgi:hypothetical protein
MKYQIIVKLDDNQFETEIEGDSWEEVYDYVFGRIELIDKNEDSFGRIDTHIVKPIEKLAQTILDTSKD